VRIDWFTLVAQIINFLVLVWLLRRFLYTRIVQAMADREAKIAGRLDDAARIKAEAEQEAADYREKTRELKAQQDDLLHQAEQQAEQRRHELVAGAREEARQIRNDEQEAMAAEWRGLTDELGMRLGQRSVDLARRSLADLATADLEAELVKVFLTRLAALPDDELQAMVQAARTHEATIEVRTAFPLQPDRMDALARALREYLGQGAEVSFEIRPELVLGIEVDVGTHQVAWNVAEHLEGLEDEFLAALEARTGRDVR
jgi:F-type H+-transporting ATPase subunit b